MRLHYARRERAEYFRHNQAIHEKIVEATRNAVLLDVYRKLSGRVRRARFAANLSDERWSRAVREHDEILDALSRRDGPRLRTLLQQHLRNKLDVVRHALSTPTAVPAGTAPSPAVAAQP
jgi:DNA-binding GntR family transcriptional regulator